MRLVLALVICLGFIACGDDTLEAPQQPNGDGGSSGSGEGGAGGTGGGGHQPPTEHELCREKNWLMTQTEDGLKCLPPAQSEEECVEIGGDSYYFNGVYWACFMDTIDGGNPCDDLHDCDGYCEAPPGAETGDEASGVCSSRTMEPCIRHIVKGVVQQPICV